MTVDGTPVSAGGEAWRGLANAATCVASPKEGTLFVRWEGAPDGVDATSASIVLPSGCIVNLTAIFRTWDVSASMYVKRGLVTLLDGIENAGAGAAHDDNATTWKNIAPDTVGLYDMTLTGHGSFTDNALWTDGNGPGATDAAPYAGTLGTMEVFYTLANDIEDKNLVFYTTGRSAVMPFSGEALFDWSLFAMNQDRGFCSQPLFPYRFSPSPISYQGTHGVSSSEGSTYDLPGRFLYDGRRVINRPLDTLFGVTVTDARASGVAAVGDFGVSSGNVWPVTADFRMHSIRLYSVKLTDEEVAWNLAFDKIRILGAVPDDVLPEGARFNPETKKYEVVVRVTYEPSMGSVTADGEPISTGWSQCTESGASDAVVLVATPSKGCAFVGWQGVPASIDVTSPRITCPLGTLANVRADFFRTTYFVAPDGDDEAPGGPQDPFATIGKGITAAKGAHDVLGGTIALQMADGTYDAVNAILDRPISVIGNVAHPENVVIRGSDVRAFLLSHEGARVAGVKIVGTGHKGTGVKDNTGGGHVRIEGAGTVEDAVIDGGRSSSGYIAGFGGNVWMSGGRLCRVRVMNGQASTESRGYDSGCLGSNIRATGGVIENCLVTGGKSVSASDPSASIDLGGSAKVVNCTVVGNEGSAYGGIHVTDAGAQVIDCVFYGNGGTAAKEWGGENGACFVNCAVASAAAIEGGVGNVSTVDDSSFADFTEADYRPRLGGALSRSGVTWGDYLGSGAISGTDLVGRPRKNGYRLDIGCYSGARSGLVLFMK